MMKVTHSPVSVSWLLLPVCLMLLSRTVMAMDITLPDGSSLRGCEVTKVESSGVRVTHRDGVAFVPFSDLPHSLQVKYGWSPEKAAALRAEQQRKVSTLTPPTESNGTPKLGEREPDDGRRSTRTEAPKEATASVLTPPAAPSQKEQTRFDQPGGPVERKDVAQSSPRASGNLVVVLTLGLGILFLRYLFRGKSAKPASQSVPRPQPSGKAQSPTVKMVSDESPASITDVEVPQEREVDPEPIVATRARTPPEPPRSHLSFSVRSTLPERLPPNPEPNRAAAGLTWHEPGQATTLYGLRIDGGMVYTTTRAMRWPGEPSAIITSLPVGKRAADALQDFGYFPAYEHISPEQRRCYLEWLAAGRQDGDPTQRSLGYVFLFFYGLERRLFVEGVRDPALLDEAIRLLQHYGPAHKSRSLKSYALQLLHFAGWHLGPDFYRTLWPRLLEFDGERADPDGLRFVLANLYQRGEPLDWTVAYRVALAAEQSRRSSVVSRAREKFWQLFEQRFAEHYPDGLRLQAAKHEALLLYRPASSALVQLTYETRRPSSFEVRLPNVAGMHRQFNTLPEIWNSCVEDLSGYSRTIGKNMAGQAAAVAAWQALPPELQRRETHPFQTAFHEVLASAPREGDHVFVPAGVFGRLNEIPERAKLSAAQSRDVAELARGLGYCIAPDPHITGLSLSWNQELALFPAAPSNDAEHDLSGAVRLLYLAVAVAAADGVVEAVEMETLHRLLAPQIQGEDDWRPLLATEASLRRDTNIAVRALPQITKHVPIKSRPSVLRTTIHIAAADGEVTLDELKLLRRIARSLELDPESVEKMLRDDDAFQDVRLEGRSGKPGIGEAASASTSGKSAAFALDQNRIKALTEETREVISMLSGVMDDGDGIEAVPATIAIPTTRSADWLHGLDARYHDAVQHLARYDEITGADFEALATRHHLLPDDLIDSVNAWADEKLGDFLLERGENVRVFRVLLPAEYAEPLAA